MDLRRRLNAVSSEVDSETKRLQKEIKEMSELGAFADKILSGVSHMAKKTDKIHSVLIAGTASRAETLLNAGHKATPVSPLWSAFSDYIGSLSSSLSRSQATLETYVTAGVASLSAELGAGLAKISADHKKASKERKKTEDMLEKLDGVFRKAATAALTNRAAGERGSDKDKKKAAKKQPKLDAALASAEGNYIATREHTLGHRKAMLASAADALNQINNLSQKYSEAHTTLLRKLTSALLESAAALATAPDFASLSPALTAPGDLVAAFSSGKDLESVAHRALAVGSSGVGESDALAYAVTKLGAYYVEFARRLRKAVSTTDSGASSTWSELLAATARVVEDFEAGAEALSSMAASALTRHSTKASAVLNRVEAVVSSLLRELGKWNDKLIKARTKANMAAKAEAEERVTLLGAEARSLFPTQIAMLDEAEAARASSLRTDSCKVAGHLDMVQRAILVYYQPVMASIDTAFLSMRDNSATRVAQTEYPALLTQPLEHSRDSEVFPFDVSLPTGTRLVVSRTFVDDDDSSWALVSLPDNSNDICLVPTSHLVREQQKQPPQSPQGRPARSMSIGSTGNQPSHPSSHPIRPDRAVTLDHSAARRKTSDNQSPSRVLGPPPSLDDNSSTPSTSPSVSPVRHPPPPITGSFAAKEADAMLASINRKDLRTPPSPGSGSGGGPPKPSTPRTGVAPGLTTMAEADNLLASLNASGPPRPSTHRPSVAPGLTTMAEADNLLASLNGPPKPSTHRPNVAPGLTTMAEADNLLASLNGARPPPRPSRGPTQGPPRPTTSLDAAAEASNLLASLAGPPPPLSDDDL